MRTPAHHLLTLRRRKWWFLLPAAAVLALTLAAIVSWPRSYRSEATILIEEAEVPEDLQGLMVAEYVEKRFEAITRRVMVTDSLLGIVERYGLYPEARRSQPVAKVAAAMRADIHTEMIRANVVDPKSGQRKSLTVAFTLAFDYPEPETAQRVANELVSLYLGENIRQKRERAAETAGFVRSSLEEAEARIREVEREQAEFKGRHAGLLPEDQLAAQAGIARLESEQRDLDRQLGSLKQREAYLAATLAQTEPSLAYGENGQPQSPAARLEAMRAELVRLEARYRPDHPDIVRLRREVAALEGKAGGGETGAAALRRQAERLRQELAGLGERYGEAHPDVQAKRRELARTEAALAEAAKRAPAPAPRARPDNPAYVSLEAELASVKAELAALGSQAGEVARSLKELRERMLRAPQVEREHQLLQRRLQDAMAVREELTKMEASVQLGQSLDSQLKAEQLSLIEPPSLPERPEKPNKRLLLLVGLVLAGGAGAAGVVLGQLLDDAVWTAEELEALLGRMPLAVIPHLPGPAERALARLRPGFLLGAAASAALLALARLVPLQALRAGLRRRAGLLGGIHQEVRP
jgi:uncharacterized protein involved in exopolysaccharide biosynthesis